MIGPGCKTMASGSSASAPSELVAKNVRLSQIGRLVDALGLHAQHDNHIGARERLFDVQLAADVGRETFKLARHPHRRTAEHEGARGADNIPTVPRGYAGCRENRHVQRIEAAFAIANCQRI